MRAFSRLYGSLQKSHATETSKKIANPNPLWILRAQHQKRIERDEAELGARSRTGGGLRGAGTAQGRNFITKNAPLAAKIDLERPDAKQQLHSSHDGGRAALSSPPHAAAAAHGWR